MTNDTDKKTIFNVLSNELRKRIFELVSEEPRSYTWLLEELEIESGHLAYHIRNMGGLIEKDETGIYQLSKLGNQTLQILEQEHKKEIKPVSRLPLIVGLVLLAIISSSLFLILQSGNQGFGETKYREESYMFLNGTLEDIYVIFDEQAVDRDSFTELVINLVGLQERLSKLSELGYPYLSEYSDVLSAYIDEFTEILKINDDRFLVLTVEKRQMIRDLHTILVELEPLINNK